MCVCFAVRVIEEGNEMWRDEKRRRTNMKELVKKNHEKMTKHSELLVS